MESVKQTLTTFSTMEAEYIACYQASCQAMWLQNFIFGLVIMDTIAKPLKIF
jgi:fluoride ion exporter CrcB/FEX